MNDDEKYYMQRTVNLMDFYQKSGDTVEKFEKIIENCQKTKTKYTDPDFYPAKKVVEDKKVLGNHQWKRVEDYYPNLLKNISPDSICQGTLGDCYFISSLIYTAHDKNQVINLFHPKSSLECGCVLVYLYFLGERMPIIVDTMMPFHLEDSGYDPNIPLFSNPKSKEDSCWFLLVEKAYAKACGFYESIVSGSTSYGVRILLDLFALSSNDFKDFLPKSVFNQDNSKFNFNREVFKYFKKQDNSKFNFNREVFKYFINEISRLLKKQAMIGCGIAAQRLPGLTSEELKEKTGLITDHAYQILDARLIQKKCLLKIRNPWGRYEWTGAYSDDSAEMTEKLKKQLNHVSSNDGTFWMTNDDFMKYFNGIDYAFPKEKDWKQSNVYGIIEGYLDGRSPGYGEPNTGCIPQWSIKFTKKTVVRVSYDSSAPKTTIGIYFAKAHGRKVDQITNDKVQLNYIACDSFTNGIEYQVEDISEPYTFFVARKAPAKETLYFRILVESPDTNYTIEKFDDNFMKLKYSVSDQSMFVSEKEFWDPNQNLPLGSCKQWYLRFPQLKKGEKPEIMIQFFKNKTEPNDVMDVILANTNEKIGFFKSDMTIIHKILPGVSEYEEFPILLDDESKQQWTLCVYRTKPMHVNQFKFIIWSKTKIELGLYPDPDPLKSCAYSISGRFKPGKTDGAMPTNPENSLISMKQWCIEFKKSPTNVFVDFNQKNGSSHHFVFIEMKDKIGEKIQVLYQDAVYFMFIIPEGCVRSRESYKIENISKPYALCVTREAAAKESEWNINIFADNEFSLNEIDANGKIGKSAQKFKPEISQKSVKPLNFSQIKQIEQPNGFAPKQISKIMQNEKQNKNENQNQNVKKNDSAEQKQAENNTNVEDVKKSQSKCCLLI